MDRSEELRFVTYLSPGIPRAFFEAVVEHVRRTLGRLPVSCLWHPGSLRKAQCLCSACA
jgi:hypothetical protein